MEFKFKKLNDLYKLKKKKPKRSIQGNQQCRGHHTHGSILAALEKTGMWGLWSVCACQALGGYCLWYGSTSGGAVREVVCVHVSLESSRARPPQLDTEACHHQPGQPTLTPVHHSCCLTPADTASARGQTTPTGRGLWASQQSNRMCTDNYVHSGVRQEGLPGKPEQDRERSR